MDRRSRSRHSTESGCGRESIGSPLPARSLPGYDPCCEIRAGGQGNLRDAAHQRKPVVRWEQALEVGQDLPRLKPGNSFGFGVDTGMGFFGDIDAARLLTADERAPRSIGFETRP